MTSLTGPVVEKQCDNQVRNCALLQTLAAMLRKHAIPCTHLTKPLLMSGLRARKAAL
jgi:hypothetical protein